LLTGRWESNNIGNTWGGNQTIYKPCLLFASISAGKSWNSLKYGVHETEDESHPDNLLYNKYGGLGFLDGFFLDAHFR
jgi:hypothetical protein